MVGTEHSKRRMSTPLPSPSTAQVLKVDPTRQAIVIKGCVPGKPGTIVEVTQAKIVSRLHAEKKEISRKKKGRNWPSFIFTSPRPGF